MTTTGARVFVDTNVLLRYRIASAPLHPQAVQLIAEQQALGAELWISRQVIREYVMQLTRQQAYMQALPIDEVEKEIQTIMATFQIADETAAVTKQWIALLKQFPTGGKQVHDANIVATMLVNDVSVLLTNNVSDMKRYANLITTVPLT